MRRTPLLGLLVLLSGASPGQAQPTAGEILKRVGETYRAAKEYELVIDSGGNEPGESRHQLFAFRAPKQYRFEGKPGESSSVGLMVHDGTRLWLYFPMSNEYAAYSAEELSHGALDAGLPGTPESMEEFVMGPFRRAAELTNQARLIREDVLEFDGDKVDCYVVSVATHEKGYKEQSAIWWIEKVRSRVLRIDDAAGYTIFTSIKLNELLPDDLFKFVPPPGSRSGR